MILAAAGGGSFGGLWRRVSDCVGVGNAKTYRGRAPLIRPSIHHQPHAKNKYLEAEDEPHVEEVDRPRRRARQARVVLSC